MNSRNWKLKNKVGAHKGEHCPTRTTHSFGTRVRRFDIRLGTIYLLVPKLRKGDYIPFFVNERKRSEQALLEGGSRSLYQWRFHLKKWSGSPIV